MTTFDPKNTQESLIFLINLPGYQRKDIRVEVGERRKLLAILKNHQRKGGSDAKANIESISKLEKDVVVDEIKACFHNGVLTIAIPKAKAYDSSSPNARTPLLKDCINNSQNYIFHRIFLPDHRMDDMRVVVQHLPYVKIIYDVLNSSFRVIQSLPVSNYDLNVNQIESSMENGLLTIIIPKDASPKHEYQNVPIKSKL